ncbi:MAG: hypothetical protein NTV97_25690 [Alphaproteobacteria bacterium]|nr:hypothetical protein [Alphaproteobacteria bacterium]
MKIEPRHCIFCGSQYQITKEHVFPKWLRSIFVRAPTDTHTFGFHDAAARRGGSSIARRISGQGQVGSKSIRKVCKKCNNGWMHDLEEDARPLLQDLVHGYSRTLSTLDQRILTDWIVKTTMTSEFLVHDQVAFTQAEREEYRFRRLPRPNWQVWCGFYTGTKFRACGVFHDALGIYLPPLPMKHGVKNTQFTILGLGHFLAISFSSEDQRLALALDGKWSLALHPLWRSSWQPTTWPLPRSLGDDALRALADGFSQSLGLPPPRME